VLADRGYFKGEEILECERSGINALVPKPQTPSPAPDKTYAPLKLEGRPGGFVQEQAHANPSTSSTAGLIPKESEGEPAYTAAT